MYFEEIDDDFGEDEPFSGEDTNIVDDVHLTSSDKHDTYEDNQSPTKFGDDNLIKRYDIPRSEEDHSNEDDAMVHETHRKIVPISNIKCRTRPYYINPKHSSYKSSRKYFLTSPSSITDLISSVTKKNV